MDYLGSANHQIIVHFHMFYIETFLLKCLIVGPENKEKQSVMRAGGRFGEFSRGNFF